MEDIVSLDYGSGGKKTSAFIEKLILPILGNETLDELGDSALIEGSAKLSFSTDSFVVSPYLFPGGDIGKLAVCGTVNDVSMGGGIPRFLSLALIIEEGMPFADLERIISSIGETARRAGVRIVTGDTKVVEKGKADGIYINTSGIGFVKHPGLSPRKIQDGDIVILSGTAGEHGTAVMLARNTSLVSGSVVSDCAPLNKMAEALMDLGADLRVLRDPTRGGVATTLCEFAEAGPFGIELEEARIPVSRPVASACDILGLDPLYCACEGRLLAVVAPQAADTALETIKSFPEGRDAAVIGRVSSAHPGRVTLSTPFGGSRILTKLSGAQLPRIC